MSCQDCIKYFAKKNKTTPCKTCKKEFPITENYEAYRLLTKYRDLFVDGMGGVNAEGIRLVLDIENIPNKERSLMTQKILVYISTAITTQQENK